jgi:hypothetical protein
MTAVPFDTLKLARTLRDRAHMTQEQAEGVSDALAEAMSGADLVTKEHLDNRLRDLEQRLTIKLGAMLAAGIAIVATVVKLVH